MKSFAVALWSDIPEKRSRTVRIGKTEIALFKLTSGEIHAVENRCPHKAGKLSEGMVCDDHVYCPLHDWKISIKDGIVQDPDTGCVKTFPVQVNKETGQIMVFIEDKVKS